jgi:uncharacterized protein
MVYGFMAPEAVLPVLLAVQGILGGIDTLLNHELIEGLPRRTQARREIGLHSIREAIYAVLLGGLGWLAWHGAAAYIIAALVVTEVGVTAVDEWTENRIRVMPQNERVLHLFLTLNMGAIIALLIPILNGWRTQPTALVLHEHGWLSWVLLLLGVAAAAWSLRDLRAWLRLRKAQPPHGA